MPQHPDDPRLTAYLLGELSADEAAAIAEALATDPVLRAELEELTQLQRDLTAALAPVPRALRPAQRAAVRHAARQRSWQPWLMPLAAALTLAALIFSNPASHWQNSRASHPAAKPESTEPPQEPATKATAAQPLARAAIPATPAAALAAAGSPTLELPVQAGRAGLAQIRAAIRTAHHLPARDSVRLEEILNNFPLTPRGLTAVARNPANPWHPDDRGTGATSHAATLATETLACPWKPSASLVLVTLRGNPFSDCQIQAVFRPNPANILRCRLLGFAPVAGQTQRPQARQLAAKTSTSLVLEVEPSTAAGDLGAIEWSVNGEPAATVAIARHGDTEPSDDARFAALVCTFAQWLAGESPALIDSDLLAALARESATTTLPADRADLLELIDQAFQL
ncbi:MAG: hypothetical protein WCJ14_00150 [Verrucomicrobiota bacterium]